MRLLARLQHAKPWSFLGLAAFLEHVALQKRNGVICITGYTERSVRNLNPRTWIVPNAVDPRFFSVQNEFIVPPDRFMRGACLCEEEPERTHRHADSIGEGDRFSISISRTRPRGE